MSTLKFNFNKINDLTDIINEIDIINEPINISISNHVDAINNNNNIKLNFRKQIESRELLYSKIKDYLLNKNLNINIINDIIICIDNEIKDNNYTDNIVNFYIKNYIYLITKEDIIFKLNNNILKADDIPNLTILDIDSNISSEYERTEKKKNDILKSAITSELFKCPKCGNNCSYTERQDRGADESMTVHVQCQNKACNHYYKIN